jgi:predicted nucleotidyltransferase
VDTVADPGEGLAADGTIRTGARRDRVPALFEPVLMDAIAFLGESGASLYVYGSVANGTARPGSSDVDLLSIGLADAAILGQRLSLRYADRCRAVEVAAATSADFAGDSDTAYGYLVFLRHYCVHLAGPDPRASLPAFPGDARAARGFNGDLGQRILGHPPWPADGPDAANTAACRGGNSIHSRRGRSR